MMTIQEILSQVSALTDEEIDAERKRLASQLDLLELIQMRRSKPTPVEQTRTEAPRAPFAMSAVRVLKPEPEQPKAEPAQLPEPEAVEARPAPTEACTVSQLVAVIESIGVATPTTIRANLPQCTPQSIGDAIETALVNGSIKRQNGKGLVRARW